MTQPPANLDAAQSSALQQAFAVLQRGDIHAALSTVRAVLAKVPDSPDALHLLALIYRKAGDAAAAEQAFEAALARAPRDAQILSNYAALLSRTGRVLEGIARYKQSLSIDPNHGETWMNLGLAELRRGDAVAADAAMQRATALRPNSTVAWQALGSAKRELNEFDAAETALRKSVDLAPKNGAAWTSLGLVRRAVGDPEEALACYAKARAAGFASPELDDAEAGTHVDIGEIDKALELARALTCANPDYVAGHVMLAHVLWESGAADPLAEFRAAVAARADNAVLRAAFINTLLEAGHAAEALEHVQTLRIAADNPALVVAHAEALHHSGDAQAAAWVFDDAAPRMPPAPRFLTAYARQMLRVGRPDAAAAKAEHAAQVDPLDQEAYSLLSVAWRLLEDPREDWLCGYDRYVMTGAIEPPPGYADVGAFIAALRETLIALHVTQRAPLQQSLREGSQTQGNLFGRRDPVIAAARDALQATARRLIAALPHDASHPFLKRKRDDIRFIGSWSVRLRSSGKHINHFHPEGWVSSAFYVALPESVTREGSEQGAIHFGQPPEDFGLSLPPRRIVRPEVGTLVLFPSYMWHGTTPFEDASPRLTIAFDALPRG